MLVFALTLLAGPSLVPGGGESPADAHEVSDGRGSAHCMPAGNAPSHNASSCSGVGTPIPPALLSVIEPTSLRQSPLRAERLYLSLVLDRLERPPAFPLT